MAILGVDIAKKTFDVTLIDEAGQKHQAQFNNTSKGFKKLDRWLTEILSQSINHTSL